MEIIGLSEPQEIFSLPPLFSFDILFKTEFKGPEKKTIERLRVWADKLIASAEAPVFPQLPEVKETSKVYGIYQQVFGPFIEWQATEGMRYARALAKAFRSWRREKGLLLYDDLIELLYEKAPENYGLSVVLDEAQDTSPLQLKLLKKLSFVCGGKLQLTMVGDPQQSIYNARASLPDYLKTHQDLIKNCGAEELTFSVTFRCSETVVDWVNILGCGNLFTQSLTQATFVPLSPRPDATTGEVSRWVIGAGEIPEETNSDDRDWFSARAFAAQLKLLNFPREASHQIAILAPRKDWLFKLAATLGDNGFRVQLHAEASNSNPAERLLKALLYLMRYPFDSFELIGFLREVTAVDDVTLAKVARETPELLTMVTPPDEAVLPPVLFAALQEFHAAWLASRELSLPAAIAKIVKDIHLDNKMAALAEVYGENFYTQWQREIARVLALATTQESLKNLLQVVDEPEANTPIEMGTLQLMTIHKAKGLQWPVVFMPFLHRPNNGHKPSYPAIDPDNRGEKLTWHLSPERTHQKERENTERLLYVAMTRPQEQLVLVDDSAFYKDFEFSSAEVLDITKGREHETSFQKLPTLERLLLQPVEKITPMEAPRGRVLPDSVKLLPIQTPSSFVSVDHIPEGELPQKGGVDYGDYWHNLWLGRLPAVAQREDFLLKKAALGRFSARATEDLKKLFASPLWIFIQDATVKVQTEVPFLAHIDDIVLEGRADMILLSGGKTLVVDWKTDQMLRAKLIESYTPQLMAYKKAFKTLTSGEVEVSLYATVLGEWIPVT